MLLSKMAWRGSYKKIGSLGYAWYGAILTALSWHVKMPSSASCSTTLLRYYFASITSMLSLPRSYENWLTLWITSKTLQREVTLKYDHRAVTGLPSRERLCSASGIGYGAYVDHVIPLTDDTSLKSVDWVHLKGYIHKWKPSRLLIGAAICVDALKDPSLLSWSLKSWT